MPTLFRLPWTLTGLVLSAWLITAALVFKLDVVKINLELLQSIEKNQIDDLVVGCLLLGAGIALDGAMAQARRRQEMLVSEQRLRVLKATMHTVHDISNNFLNSVQLFCVECEDSIPPDARAALDRRIAEMSQQLKQLGDMESTPERQMAIGVGIDVSPASRKAA